MVTCIGILAGTAIVTSLSAGLSLFVRPIWQFSVDNEGKRVEEQNKHLEDEEGVATEESESAYGDEGTGPK